MGKELKKIRGEGEKARLKTLGSVYGNPATATIKITMYKYFNELVTIISHVKEKNGVITYYIKEDEMTNKFDEKWFRKITI